MKLSLEWLRDYVDLPADLDVRELAHELTLKTVEVEGWEHPGARLNNIVVARVTAVTALAAGGALLTCGVGPQRSVRVATVLTDVEVGSRYALALLGARLSPRGSGEPREVRVVDVLGTRSEAVLCSPADVGLQNLFAGSDTSLLDLRDLDVPPGTPLASAIGFDDAVLEIDNKSLTNRPDLWGHYGIARELAAIFKVALCPLPTADLPPAADDLVGRIDPALCRRFTALSFELSANGPAPLWMRSRLARVGENSHSLCVDLTNYVMHAVGQPTQVYDRERIRGALTVRAAGATTKVDLLAGETRELEPATPVVADADGPVAVAGIIGAEASSVTGDTRSSVFEAANFQPRPVRTASQRLSLRTEASARFEKNLDVQRIDQAVALFLRLLTEIQPDAELGGFHDVTLETTERAMVDVSLEFLADRIGEPVSADNVTASLGSLGFDTSKVRGDLLCVTAPPWRSTGDISLPHDIIEEVARLRGYDNIPTAGLSVILTPARSLHAKPLDRAIREQLALRGGLHEVVTYPWASDALLAATGHPKGLRFDGAPAPDRDSLRPSLVPGLIEAVASNLRYTQQFGIFEVGAVFDGACTEPYRDRFEHLPVQNSRLAVALTGAEPRELFLKAKGMLDMLRHRCHLMGLAYADASGEAPVWADRSARLAVTTDAGVVGHLGLLTNRCRRVGEIGAHVAILEVDLDRLTAPPSRHNRYAPLPEHPDSDFELSVVVADTVAWDEIARTVRSSDRLIHSVEPLGEYRGTWVPADHRSLSMRIVLRAPGRTLTAEDIAGARAVALEFLAREHEAGIRRI